MNKYKYQNNLSEQSPILLDGNHKHPKTRKMLSVLRDAGILDRGGVALDIGCSIGFFANSLAEHFNKVVGIDIDRNALGLGVKESGSNVCLMVADSMELPFEKNFFDLVVCNHVYEHVPDVYRLFDEIERVLKPGGACYLGAASRLTIIEPHYKLYFLSWLPKKIANVYMRLFKRGDVYYENLRTRWGMNELISRFSMIDYTLEIISNPDKYCARDMIKPGGIIDRAPRFLLKGLYYFLPSYIFLLFKK